MANQPKLSVSADALRRKTWVIIPALNEAETLPAILQNPESWPLAGVRVEDNGSTDDTVELASNMGAEVILKPTLGYGSACWKGMQNLPDSTDWILFCDADGCDDLHALTQSGISNFCENRVMARGIRCIEMDGRSVGLLARDSSMEVLDLGRNQNSQSSGSRGVGLLRHLPAFTDAARLVFRMDPSIRVEIEKHRFHLTFGLFHGSPLPFPTGREVDILMVGAGDHLGSISRRLHLVARQEEGACATSFHQDFQHEICPSGLYHR